MTQLQKVENPIELNFEELGDAGISVDEINRSLANQLGFNYQLYLEDGGKPEDFLYQQTTVAPKGVISAATDAIIRSIVTTGPETAGAITGAQQFFRRTPGPLPAKTLSGFFGAISAAWAAAPLVTLPWMF